MKALRKKRSDQERWKDKFDRPAPRQRGPLLSLVGVHLTQVESPAAPSDQGADGQSLGPTVSPKQGLAPNPQSLGPTVSPSISENTLRTDGRSEVSLQREESLLLAPLQWEVRQLLQGIAQSQAIISVRQIANQLRASMEGVKKAIRVLKKIGIVQTTAVRTADVQGFRVHLKTEIPVRKGTLNEARGIIKRLGLTPNGRSQVLRTNPPMYVCKKNTYIQEEDIKNLLGVCPVEWKIREATLITIADYYPDMDPTTFRLSLLQALEQAREGKAVIKKPNAWLKAAFEKNGAPLITARDIEAQVTRGQGATIKHRAASQADHHLVPAAQPEESEILRRYLAAPEDQRQEIDHQAAEHLAEMQPMLDQIGPDKTQEILIHARIEAARAVLAIPASAPGDEGEDH